MAKTVATLPAEPMLTVIDQAFERRSWHGSNLRGSLRGVRLDAALWRPAPERHCIWEIALHCAYWKYVVHRRIVGGVRRGSFPLAPSNWPALPAPANARAWRASLGLLDESHARLRDTVEHTESAGFARKSGTWTVRDLVLGVAAHDLYHAGQIQLLKRLRSSS